MLRRSPRERQPLHKRRPRRSLLPSPRLRRRRAARPFAERTAKWLRIDGYMPLFWDEAAGRLWMEIGRFNSELLYQVSLPAGVGSNPIGLDRGQLGDSAVVVFERVGPRVLMVQQNYRYRALTGDPAERRAVEQSFAKSVLWGFKVEASEGDRVLVDATAFFLRDAHGVIEKLRETKQGRYKLDDSRSALYLARTKGFPKNTEVEATLTFTTDEDPGPLHQRRRANTDGGHGARTPLLRRTAAVVGRLPASPPRSPRQFLRHHVLRLRVAHHRSNREAMDRQASPSEEGPECRHLGAGETDRLLRRQRRAGAHPFRSRARRLVVERGVRSCRFPKRLPGESAAGRCRSDGSSIQHDQLGPSVDARLVVRRQRCRSANRTDSEGERDARFVARPAGRPARQRHGAAVCGRQPCQRRPGAFRLRRRCPAGSRLSCRSRSEERRGGDGARPYPPALGP